MNNESPEGNEVPLSSDERRRILTVAKHRDELRTIVDLGMEVGVPSRVSRRIDVDRFTLGFGWVSFVKARSTYSRNRRIPTTLSKFLRSRCIQNGYLCPELGAMTGTQFNNYWSSVLRAANIPRNRTLNALTFSFRVKYPDLELQEEVLGRLEFLTREWFEPSLAEYKVRQLCKLDEDSYRMPIPSFRVRTQ